MATIPYSQAQVVLTANLHDIDTDGDSGANDDGRCDFIAPFNCRIRWCMAAVGATTNTGTIVLSAYGSDGASIIVLNIPTGTVVGLRTNAEVGVGQANNQFAAGSIISVRSDGTGSAGGFSTLMLVIEPS